MRSASLISINCVVTSGSRSRAGVGSPDVRVSRDPEGAGIHPRRPATGGGARAGRTRAEMCQGPEWKPCGMSGNNKYIKVLFNYIEKMFNRSQNNESYYKP